MKKQNHQCLVFSIILVMYLLFRLFMWFARFQFSKCDLRTYLYRILGQWDISLLNFTSIGFRNFIQMSHLQACSSLVVTTSASVKKKNSKMRHLKKFVKPIFEFFFFTNADLVTIKDETSKKIVKPMEVNRTCIGFTNFLQMSHL